MDEGDHAFGPSSRHAVHKFDPFALQPSESACEVVDDVTEMMESRFGVLGDELRDPRIAVGRLDELDALVLIAQEDDADMLVHKLVDPLGAQPERVAEKWERLFEARHRDRNVVQWPELHSRGGT